MKKMHDVGRSPCETCTRVKDPGNCENKNCTHWRKWFLKKWELLRSYPRNVMDEMLQPVEGDPCSQCASPRELCRTPCRSCRKWMEQKEAAL